MNEEKKNNGIKGNAPVDESTVSITISESIKDNATEPHLVSYRKIASPTAGFILVYFLLAVLCNNKQRIPLEQDFKCNKRSGNASTILPIKSSLFTYLKMFLVSCSFE